MYYQFNLYMTQKYIWCMVLLDYLWLLSIFCTIQYICTYVLCIYVVGMAIYTKPSKQYPGIYFPRNSFVTDGTPILIEGNTKYRIRCYSSGAGQVSWYYSNGTKVPFSGPYTSYYSTQYKFNHLTRLISLNPSNNEFCCKGNERTAWFGMFVNPS